MTSTHQGFSVRGVYIREPGYEVDNIAAQRIQKRIHPRPKAQAPLHIAVAQVQAVWLRRNPDAKALLHDFCIPKPN